MLHACAVAAIAIAVAPAKVPTIEIAPGVDMPLVGIGTWQYDSMTAASEVTNALRLGYRHIDTAIGYKNQLGVGHAIHTGIEGLGIPRKQMFVVSKIPGGLNQSAATEQLELSVSQLFPEAESAYVDLMLIHFPATWGGVGGKAMRQEEWRAMEAFAKAGKARAIGISHYCKRHLNDILEIATIKPAVNQVQVPY